MKWQLTGLILFAFFGAGCATNYRTPAAGVSLAAIDDTDIRELYAIAPAALFPANIALLRVQDSGYYTKTNRGYGHGRYTVVTTRDIESDASYEKVGNLPLVRLIRVPIRFMMPVTLALAVLATFGATILARRVESSAARLGLLLAIGLAFSAEATFAPLRTWPHEEEVRPVNQFLADQPGDFAIVEFPLDPFGYAINARQVYQSIYHWKRLLVGYSGFQSRENIELLRRVRDRFPTDECLDELNALDVRFVVVLRGRAKPSLLSAVAAQPRLERVLRADGRDMYRVLPPVTTAR